MTMAKSIDIQTVIANLEEQANKATAQFNRWSMTGEDWDDPSWIIAVCFIQLLAALEALSMPELRSNVYSEYKEVLASPSKFLTEASTPDGESYSPVLSGFRRYLLALKALLPSDKHTTVTKDLLDIIRNVHYVITDTDVFPIAPQNEKDVHLRIEAILKCVFPDLKRKPSLSKQIKNFEPDTGIPSLKPLLSTNFCHEK